MEVIAEAIDLIFRPLCAKKLSNFHLSSPQLSQRAVAKREVDDEVYMSGDVKRAWK